MAVAAGNDKAALLWNLKQIYDGQETADIAAHEVPLLSILTREGNSTDGPGMTKGWRAKRPQLRDTGKGESYPLPIMTDPPAGISPDFAVAQAAASGGRGQKFQIKTGECYAVVPFGYRELEITDGDKAAFQMQLAAKTDSYLNRHGLRINDDFYRSGTGALTTIESHNDSTDVITVANKRAMRSIGRDCVLVASETGASLRAGEATVTKVDIRSGTFTVNDIPATWDDGDLLYFKGAFGPTVAADAPLIRGLPDWIPTTVASNDDFFGVNRSENTKLAGYYHNGSGTGLVRMQRAASAGHSLMGARPDLFICTPAQWMAISLELQNTGYRDFTRPPGEGNFGFESISITMPWGKSVPVISDPSCQSGDGFFVHSKHMFLVSAGDPIHLEDREGQGLIHRASSAEYEMRFSSFVQLAIDDPSQFIRVAMPADPAGE